jgi:hypothetical protein
MPVPNIFGSATSAIPLSQLDQNFATAITLGNTAVYLGNTTTSLGNVTLTNVTISSGNVSVSTATVGAGSNTAPSITTTGDTNTGIFFPAADTIAFSEGGVEAMRLDSAGNMGLGVTPSAWGSSDKAIDIGGGNQSSISANLAGAFATNAYFNGTDWKYKNSSGTPGLYSQSFDGQHKWFRAASGTAGNTISFTQAMTLDASGNLLVGQQTGASTTTPIRISSGGTYGTTLLNGIKVAAFDAGGTLHGMGVISGSLYLNTTDATTVLAFGTNNTERARIDSSGNLLVGTTSATVAGSLVDGIGVDGKALTGSFGLIINSTSSTGSQYFQSYGRGGSQCGYVASNTTNSTTYATSSDYRLKENIAPMTGALAVVAQLKPSTYNWKVDGSNGQGFIAHELQEIIPTAVVGEKDEVDAGGNPKYQGIDTSFLVATLTAAIQEQQAIITTLTDRITALEAK